jgi:hypothetical protein
VVVAAVVVVTGGLAAGPAVEVPPQPATASVSAARAKHPRGAARTRGLMMVIARFRPSWSVDRFELVKR